MEDCNMLAADCLVISCCCQCLVLQVLVFLLLKLPIKLLQKTKNYARRKLWQRKKEKKVMGIVPGHHRYRDEFIEIQGGSVRIQVGEFLINGGHGCCNGGCMEEVDKVLEELSQRGEFAFGSFWGWEETEGFPTCVGSNMNITRIMLNIISLK